MREMYNKAEDMNFLVMSPVAFLAYYNENIPAAFPEATLLSLKRFRAACPSLFTRDERSDEWTIDKHRKKFMDWFTTNRD